jgi:plasmid stability protein
MEMRWEGAERREEEMAALTIPNVPDSVVRRLEEQARQRGCSLEVEARLCLEEGLSRLRKVVPKTPEEVNRILEEIRIHRESLHTPPLTEEFLQEAKNWGRP